MSKSSLFFTSFCDSFIVNSSMNIFSNVRKNDELWQQKKSTTDRLKDKFVPSEKNSSSTLIYGYNQRTTAVRSHKIRLKKHPETDKQSIRLPCPSIYVNRYCLWSFDNNQLQLQVEFKRRPTTIASKEKVSNKMCIKCECLLTFDLIKCIHETENMNVHPNIHGHFSLHFIILRGFISSFFSRKMHLNKT